MTRSGSAVSQFGFVVGFGGARALLFAAPLVLANVLPAEDYGRLEYSQAIGSLLAIFVGFGLSNLVPLTLIRRIEGVHWPTMAATVFVVGAISVVATVALASTGEGTRLASLAVLFVGLFLAQTFWSAVLRSRGHRTASLFVDALAWSCAAGAAALAHLRGTDPAIRLDLVQNVLLALAVLYLVPAFAGARPLATSLRRTRWWRNVRLGAPLMLAGLATMLVTTSGRLFAGTLGGAPLVAVYSGLYRGALVPIVGHQLLAVGMFRDLFAVPMAALRMRTTVIVGAVGLAVALFGLAVDAWGGVLGAQFHDAWRAHRTEGAFVLAQCVLWSAIALNDLVASREGVAARVLPWSAVYLVVCGSLVVGALAAGASIDLRAFVLSHSAFMAGHFVVQCVAMWRCGVSLPLTWSVAALGFPLLFVLVETTGSGVHTLAVERVS